MVDVILTGTGAPPDIQYYLDGALECFDIPPDVYLWAYFFCPDIASVIDGFDRVPELQDDHHSHRLANYGARLERMYLDWQNVADPNAVALCLAYGITYSGDPKTILREITGTLVDDEDGVLARIDYYKRLIRHNSNGAVFYDGLEMFQRKRPFLESRYRIRRQWESLTDKPDFSTLRVIHPPRPDLRELREAMGLKRKPPEKSKKKALKRSANLLNSITGEQTVQLFLSGQEVSVTGQKYRFSLTKSKHASIDNSHGTATTKVYDKTTDEFICGLCVYTPNVTVFDHLASIILHCKSGLEDLIIDEANITSRGNLALLPQITKDRMNRPVSREEALDGIDIIERPSDRIRESILGKNWRLVDARKHRIDALNDKAFEKLSKRIAKKYPYLMEKPTARIEQVTHMFFGPEVLLA